MASHFSRVHLTIKTISVQCPVLRCVYHAQGLLESKTACIVVYTSTFRFCAWLDDVATMSEDQGMVYPSDISAFGDG